MNSHIWPWSLWGILPVCFSPRYPTLPTKRCFPDPLAPPTAARLVVALKENAGFLPRRWLWSLPHSSDGWSMLVQRIIPNFLTKIFNYQMHNFWILATYTLDYFLWNLKKHPIEKENQHPTPFLGSMLSLEDVYILAFIYLQIIVSSHCAVLPWIYFSWHPGSPLVDIWNRTTAGPRLSTTS